jgi:hypothetical protein
LLERLGFPKPNDSDVELALWPLQGNIADLNEEEINSQSLAWKINFVSERASADNIVVSISDTVDDVSSFAKLGIPAILFHSHGTAKDIRSEIDEQIGNRFIADSIELVTSWPKVANLVRALDKNQLELETLVATHSSEYASFLGQLDIKAQLLLVVATFLGTSFFGIIWYAVSQWYEVNQSGVLVSKPTYLYVLLLVVAAVGLIASLLSMTFSIRAFSSRHSRGTSSGSFIALSGFFYSLRNFVPVLFGKEICPPGSPVEAAHLAREEHGKLIRRLAHLAFFQRTYGTYVVGSID